MQQTWFEDSVKPKTNQSSSFKSKVPRLALPLAMLGTEVEASKAQNPGPGTYYEDKEWGNKQDKIQQIKEIIQEQNMRKKERMREAIEESEGLRKRKKIKPSIPSKKIPKNGYSGVKNDTPGPTGYYPQDNFTKSKSQCTIFYKAAFKKETFTILDNFISPLDHEMKTQKELMSKRDYNNNPSSMFASKVPNCKDMKLAKTDIPGPGSYQPINDVNTVDKISPDEQCRIIDSLALKNSSFLKMQLNNLTTSKSRECPFIDGNFKDNNPGPCDYFNFSAKDKVLKRLQSSHFDAIVKQKPPFNSQLERDCNRTLDNVENVGPGKYIDINNPNNSSFNKTLLKFQNNSNFQRLYGIEQKPFGSSTQRFNETQQDMQLNGNYGQELQFGLASRQSLFKADHLALLKASQNLKYGKIRESKSQGSFQFKSKLKRINFQDQKDPNIITINQENQQNTPYTQRESYNEKHKQNKMLDMEYEKKHDKQMTQRVPQMPKRQFDSSVERFVNYQAKNLALTPGPGQYEVDPQNTIRHEQKRNLSRLSKNGFCSGERKFNPKFNSYVQNPTSDIKIGLGSYYRGDNQSMVKKSFNMALEGTSFI